VYFVGSQVSWTSGDVLFDGNASNSGALIQTTSTPQVNLHAGSSVAGNTDFTVGANKVVTCVFNGASSSLGINKNTETTGNAGAANMGGLTIASAGTAGSYGNETLSEFAVYSAAHNAVTKQQVQNYEMTRWGIS
jgi:hypothetical protein